MLFFDALLAEITAFNPLISGESPGSIQAF